MSSTAEEQREAQRAARKRRIMDNKQERMSKVKGEYNQHRTSDSDDEDNLSSLLGVAGTQDYIVIEPADGGVRVALFSLLAILLIPLRHYNFITDNVSLFYPFMCVQVALLSYMHTRGYLFRKMSPAPMWSKALILLGLSHEDSIRWSKYAVFAHNLLKDYLVLYVTYAVIMYFFM